MRLLAKKERKNTHTAQLLFTVSDSDTFFVVRFHATRTFERSKVRRRYPPTKDAEGRSMTSKEKFLLLTKENQAIVIRQIEKLIADQSKHLSQPDSHR